MTLLNLLHQVDLSILFFINQKFVNPIFNFVFSLPYLYPFWGLLTMFFFLRKHDRKLAVLMVIAIIVNTMAVAVIKDLVHRERPYQTLDVRQLIQEEADKSFPSNHVQLSFLLSTIVFSFYRRSGTVLYLVSSITAVGRIYAGVHYPSDAIGGAVIGILIALLILRLRTMLPEKIFFFKV